MLRLSWKFCSSHYFIQDLSYLLDSKWDLLLLYFLTKYLLVFLSNYDACMNLRALIKQRASMISVYASSSYRLFLLKHCEIFKSFVSCVAWGLVCRLNPYIFIDEITWASTFVMFYYWMFFVFYFLSWIMSSQ